MTSIQYKTATLSFDIDNDEMTVKNLRFHSSWVQTSDFSLFGVTSHTILNIETSTSLGDFPAKSYYDGAMTTEVEVSEGLQVNAFSMVADSYTTYSDNEIEPVSTHTVYPYSDNPANKVYLFIKYK